jgi:hypothetical protein
VSRIPLYVPEISWRYVWDIMKKKPEKRPPDA